MSGFGFGFAYVTVVVPFIEPVLVVSIIPRRWCILPCIFGFACSSCLAIFALCIALGSNDLALVDSFSSGVRASVYHSCILLPYVLPTQSISLYLDLTFPHYFICLTEASRAHMSLISWALGQLNAWLSSAPIPSLASR